MAAFDTTRPTAVISAGSFYHFVSNMVGAFNTWNDARITRKSLSQLSARELEDIGLSFADIDTVAKRSIR